MREVTYNRRDLLVGTATLLSGPVFGQPSARSYRLGWVGTTAPRGEVYNAAFLDRLAELNYVEGRNLTVLFRTTRNTPDGVAAAAAELAQQRCDMIFAPGSELNLRAARQAMPELPVLIVANDYDPLRSGHVASLVRPGGRVTGVSQLQAELPAKRLEVLREMLPRVRRVAILGDLGTGGQLKVAQAAAPRLGLELVVHSFEHPPYDYAAAFAAFAKARAEALVALASGFFVAGRRTIVDSANRYHLPSVFSNVIWAELGGLLSYGPNFTVSYRRAAELAARLLAGADPAEMPIEQPNVVEVGLNLKTARTLGLTIPQAILLRADRVIE